jgi:probable F420-dependent oxidoreductase
MTLGFGLLSAQLRPAETEWTRAYDDTIRLAVEAERLGFSSVWTTEHHFVDDGYMPSLLVVSAALAQATSRIEIGTGVILAPLHHPLRLAEDAATVQLLSHGRLALGLGLGLGWSEVEYAGLGADMRVRGAAMDEILRILPRAWSGEPFTHEGSVYQLPTLAVRPTPAKPIPVLVGGGAEPALRRAARLADGIFSNAAADEFGKQVGWVLDELERADRDPSTFRFIHYSILLPGTSRGDALARYRDALWALNWKYSDMEASATRSLPPASPPRFEGDGEKLLGRRTAHAGTPDELVGALLEVRDRVPVPVEFVARSHLPLLDYDAQVEVMQQLAESVAPHV